MLMATVCAVGLFAAVTMAHAGPPERFDGFNVVSVPAHPFGSAGAGRSLQAARALGATTVAIIPFLWQAHPSSATIERGSDMSDAALRAAIRDSHAIGLKVVVKPHVWVPERWAGTVAPPNEDGWRSWFADYHASLVKIVRIAAEEKAEALVIGTELSKAIMRPEWTAVISGVRALFSGFVFYVAHDIAEAEAVPFWDRLDAIGVSLYPRLGADGDRAHRLEAMRAGAGRLDALAERHGKPVIVAEVGLRSAVGAAAKPWESAEERKAEADPQLQAQVLADWFSVLDRPSIRGILVWRWFTDPNAGGAADTDFTVQNKPAEGVLLCVWIGGCRRR